MVLDISGTRLHVRKAPGLSSMGVGRRARAGLARALPEAAVRKRTVVGCPKRQLVKQLLYEQSSRSGGEKCQQNLTCGW